MFLSGFSCYLIALKGDVRSLRVYCGLIHPAILVDVDIDIPLAGS
jgi:hypothetical protein